jgi:hypothetical protein
MRRSGKRVLQTMVSWNAGNHYHYLVPALVVYENILSFHNFGILSYLGAFVENNWGDIVIDCTMVTGGSVKYILKYPFECVATSCVSEWKSAEGQVPDEILKELEIKVCAGAAGEGSAAGSSSAGEATTGAGAAESLAAGSSAGKATGTGMLALAATSAAAALFIF